MIEKEQIIKMIEESLYNSFDSTQIQLIVENLIIVLKDYDIVKKETSLISYDNINEATLNRFCACLFVEGRSDKTIAQYRRTAEKLFQVVSKNYCDMNVYDIRMFLALEKQRGISDRTVENTRANLSAFFQWMTQEDLIPKNPCMNIAPIKYKDKVKLPFNTLEIDALRKYSKNAKERAIMELLLSSGVRVSEMTNIKLCDINFNNLSIHITNGKGAKERMVYFDELAKKYIQEYLNNRNIEGEYLFYNNSNTPLNPGGVRYILKTLGKRANVTNVHPHRFRRTFATGLANRGMDIQEIKKLLGHSDINTTMEYVYTSDDKAHTSYLKYKSS